MSQFAARHLHGVSRTYAILIPMLPRELAESVGLAYLLMRVIDTFEDAATIDDAERRQRLQLLDGVLADQRPDLPPLLCEPTGEAPAEDALLRDLPELLTRIAALPDEYRGPIVACGRGMIAGVLSMLERGAATGLPYPAIRDAAEMREYCYHVAGIVGAMLCEIMASYLRQPALRRLRDVAVELGIGLQLVNIVKDVLKDRRAGRCYLPAPQGQGVSAVEVSRFVLAEARTSLQKGVDFVLALPAAARELRYFCGLPIAWGAMTLARAERRGGPAKVGRGAIRSSIELFGKLAQDDRALRSWFDTLLRPAALT